MGLYTKQGILNNSEEEFREPSEREKKNYRLFGITTESKIETERKTLEFFNLKLY